MQKLGLGSQLVIARPLPKGSGYTWTVASLLGDMLQIAQSLFGERDLSFTILGVEFCGDHPRVWCPGNRKDIVVQLSKRCLREPKRACYQLAHECVHLIAPIGCKGAIVLEEGLATWFAAYYMRERIGAPTWHSSMESYSEAQRKAEQLLGIDPDAIKVLRCHEPAINRFTAELLLEHYPQLGEPLARDLTAPFVRERPRSSPAPEAVPDDSAASSDTSRAS